MVFGELRAYLDYESESQVAVTLSATDEVPGPWSTEFDHGLTVVEGANRVYGVT